ATLNNININVGYTKNKFVGLSNFGIKLDKSTVIMMSFTDSKILAFVSAMALISILFFNFNRFIVSMTLANLVLLSFFFSFLLCFSIFFCTSCWLISFLVCHNCFADLE